MAGISLITASPARRLAAVLRILAAAVLCIVAPAACTRENVPSDEGKFNVSVMLDTRSLNIDEVGSAVIYAFAQAASGSGYLVGYVYEDNVGKSGIFPMTLTEGGAIDFYVILNPDSNCFDLVDGDGQPVRPGPDPDTSLKPEDLRAWKIEYADSAPSDPKDWRMLPMSNLDGTAFGNRRFNIDSRPGWQTIPISVRRAVSKVEVWFRSNEDTNNNYWAIKSMRSGDPVSSCGLFTETVSHIGQGENPKSFKDNTQHSHLNTSFPENPDLSDYFSEKNFEKIFEYYILPNTLGGNTAGEAAEGEVTSSYSYLHTDYAHIQQWDAENHYSKDIFLPACSRNSCIRIWCSLNDNMDRSFTYTVVNWDETVTVNIPDFS